MAKAEKLEETVASLRQQILRGEYGIRGVLPARGDLEKEFGVTHSTMNQVILQLQGEGLITSSGTKRLSVNLPKKRVPLSDAPFARFLKEQGLEPVVEYLEPPERTPMDSTLAKGFGVPEGTLVVKRVRRDGTKQIHYRLTTRYFLSSLIDEQTLEGMRSNTEYDILKDIQEKKGVAIQFMIEDVIARLPNVEEQEYLGIVRTTPVLEMTRTYYDRRGGRVIGLNKIILVSSLFVMHREYDEVPIWR